MIHLKKAVLLAVTIICCSLSARAQEQPSLTSINVNYPSFKESIKKQPKKKDPNTDSKLTILEVELNDTTTILTLEFACLPADKIKAETSCSIGKNCFLVTTNDSTYTYYDFIGAEGIAIDPNKTKVCRGKSIIFKLFFEPLPKETQKFNLCEPGGWNLADIDMTSSNTPENQKIGTFDVKEYTVQPTFLGGDISEISLWVNQRLVYPEQCSKDKLEDTVYLKLTVDKDGIIHTSLLRGSNQLFIQEAVRVAEMLPPATPCIIYGRKCVISYTFPVIFQLYRR